MPAFFWTTGLAFLDGDRLQDFKLPHYSELSANRREREVQFLSEILGCATTRIFVTHVDNVLIISSTGIASDATDDAKDIIVYMLALGDDTETARQLLKLGCSSCSRFDFGRGFEIFTFSSYCYGSTEVGYNADDRDEFCLLSFGQKRGGVHRVFEVV